MRKIKRLLPFVLSLMLLFTKNEDTNKLLNVLEIYTEEFNDFIKDK